MANIGFLIIFALFLIVAIVGYFLYMLVNIFPSGAGQNVMLKLFDAVFGAFNSIFILLFFVLGIADVGVSALYPSKFDGFLNIFLLFFIGYVVIHIQAFLPTFSVLSANTILPTAYTFLTSNYLVALVFIFLVISTILDFREPNKSGNNEE
ncbi:MAG: hypothetical protein QXU98_07300 [Candidatus Parvarchaeota archaeon]